MLALAAAFTLLIREAASRGPVPVIPGEEIPILVEVLNATRVDGLARATTLKLRRAGIDVVYFGTASESALDSTLILIRRGDSTSGVVVRRVLGTGTIVSEMDPRLLLDVTVMLGLDVAQSGEITP